MYSMKMDIRDGYSFCLILIFKCYLIIISVLKMSWALFD